VAPDLMKDARFRKYILVAPWMYDMFRPVYGDACVRWHAGIDIDEWSDAGNSPKDIDFLIYDKIRWNHDELEVKFLNRIQAVLSARGLRTRTIRYKFHDHATYRQLLQRSRAMIFLCEHETQGLAYQEALASNVPLLAWDNGYWLDPLWKKFSQKMIPASSVPFFSGECGERFRDIEEFEAVLSVFLNRLGTFKPRKYVAENLSMKESAETYYSQYFSTSAAVFA